MIEKFVHDHAIVETKAVLTRAATARKDREEEIDRKAEDESLREAKKNKCSSWSNTNGFLESCMLGTDTDILEQAGEMDAEEIKENREEELAEAMTEDEESAEEESAEEVQRREDDESELVEISTVKKGVVMEDVRQAQAKDKTLAHWMNLASKEEKGFCWEDKLLVKKVLDDIRGEIKLVVILQGKRTELMQIANDKSANMGHKKVIELICKRFYWPFLVRNVMKYCRSCDICARCSKAGQHRAPLQARLILTEPFESMSTDIIGPFKKGKHGY